MGKTVVIELPDSSFEALRASAETNGHTPESEASRRLQQSLREDSSDLNPSEAAMLRAGLILSIPNYANATPPDKRFMTPPVSGKPISETIIEERR